MYVNKICFFVSLISSSLPLLLLNFFSPLFQTYWMIFLRQYFYFNYFCFCSISSIFPLISLHSGLYNFTSLLYERIIFICLLYKRKVIVHIKTSALVFGLSASLILRNLSFHFIASSALLVLLRFGPSTSAFHFIVLLQLGSFCFGN